MTGILKVVTVISGVLTAGEALALLVGMVGLSPRPNPWITQLNILWIGLDILCGAGLLMLVFFVKGYPTARSSWLIGIALLCMASHLYRDWEYIASQAGRKPLSGQQPLMGS
jgi:hypothetical protein